jgi:hypothetical protein
LIEGDFLVEWTEFLQFQLHARVLRLIAAYKVRKNAKVAEPAKAIESISISAFEARFAVLMADSACASVGTASVSKTPSSGVSCAVRLTRQNSLTSSSCSGRNDFADGKLRNVKMTESFAIALPLHYGREVSKMSQLQK